MTDSKTFRLSVLAVVIIAIIIAFITIMEQEGKHNADSQAIAAMTALRTNLSTAMADMNSSVPAVQAGSDNGTLHTLIYGGTVTGTNGQTISIAGIAPEYQKLFSHFNANGQEAKIKVGRPLRGVEVGYTIVTGSNSGSAMITFNSQERNSYGRKWSEF